MARGWRRSRSRHHSRGSADLGESRPISVREVRLVGADIRAARLGLRRGGGSGSSPPLRQHAPPDQRQLLGQRHREWRGSRTRRRSALAAGAAGARFATKRHRRRWGKRPRCGFASGQRAEAASSRRQRGGRRRGPYPPQYPHPSPTPTVSEPRSPTPGQPPSPRRFLAARPHSRRSPEIPRDLAARLRSWRRPAPHLHTPRKLLFYPPACQLTHLG